MELVAIGVGGLLVGSFLNVVIWRLPRGESLVSPRSRCPSCGSAIRPWDNVPLLSWGFLRGRCRSCGARVSARYPLVEAATAAAFVGAALARGVDGELALWLPFAAILIAVGGIDLDHRIIPNRIVVPAAAWGLAGTALLRQDELAGVAIAGGAAFVALFAVALVYPAGMGMGDVKLAGAMGLYLGSAVAPALLAAFLAGSVVGLAVIAREGGEARKKGVPFGPFLALGGLVGIFAGPELVDWYVDSFL